MDAQQEEKSQQEEVELETSDQGTVSESPPSGSEPFEVEDDLSGESEDELAPEGEAQAPPEADEEPEGPTKARKVFRKILIWMVVIAVSFAAGFFLDTRMRYQPARDRAQALQGELEAAELEVEELESEIDRLSAFEDRNQELQEEIDALQTHLTILSTRSAVADGLLALADDNLAEAKLALDKVGRNLDRLEDMLNEDQVEVVRNMQQRHQLIMEELEADSFSARSDLEVLSSKLGSLENTLFASP